MEPDKELCSPLIIADEVKVSIIPDTSVIMYAGLLNKVDNFSCLLPQKCGAHV